MPKEDSVIDAAGQQRTSRKIRLVLVGVKLSVCMNDDTRIQMKNRFIYPSALAHSVVVTCRPPYIISICMQKGRCYTKTN